jgi:hypothetical protein
MSHHVDYLMMEFTRLVELRATGDDSTDLDRRIGWAASALLVAQLRAEKADLLALPERTIEQRLRLLAIEAELLSPNIQLHPSAYAAGRQFHQPRGQAVDLPAPAIDRLAPVRRPWARGRGSGHVHWAM